MLELIKIDEKIFQKSLIIEKVEQSKLSNDYGDISDMIFPEIEEEMYYNYELSMGTFSEEMDQWKKLF